MGSSKLCFLLVVGGLMLVQAVPQHARSVRRPHARPRASNPALARQRSQQLQQLSAQRQGQQPLQGSLQSLPQSQTNPHLPSQFQPSQRMQRLQALSQAQSQSLSQSQSRLGSGAASMPQQRSRFQPHSAMQRYQQQRQQQVQPQQQQHMAQQQSAMPPPQSRQQRSAPHAGAKRPFSRPRFTRGNGARRTETPMMSLNHHMTSLIGLGLSTKTVGVLRGELKDVQETKDGSLVLSKQQNNGEHTSKNNTNNNNNDNSDDSYEKELYPALDMILQLIDVWQQLRLMECTPSHRKPELNHFQTRLTNMNHECDLLVNSHNQKMRFWDDNMKDIESLKQDISKEWSQISTKNANVKSDENKRDDKGHNHRHHRGNAFREGLSMAEEFVTDDFNEFHHSRRHHTRSVRQESKSSSSSTQLDDRCSMKNGRLSMRVNKIKETFSGILRNADYAAKSKLAQPKTTNQKQSA